MDVEAWPVVWRWELGSVAHPAAAPRAELGGTPVNLAPLSTPVSSHIIKYLIYYLM